MKIDKITLYHVRLKLRKPFETSFGRLTTKDSLLIKLESNGIIGWGESPHLNLPVYTSEYLEGGKALLVKSILPKIVGNSFDSPEDLIETYKYIKGNNISKAGVEMAFWDLLARKKQVPLYKLIGSKRNYSDIGISIGIEKDTNIILNKISKAIDEGYKRIKVKIKPGKDIEVVRTIREKFPSIKLMVDANSAYTQKDISHLKKLDKYNLLMIEQPLAEHDFVGHAKLQKVMKTPICLDESIHTLEDAKKAIRMNSCKIINIKPTRVGGIKETKKIHDFCKSNKIPVWIGGMLETTIGKKFLDQIATLPNFTLPGDNSSSDNYFEEDLVKERRIQKKGQMVVDEKPGIGVVPDNKLLKKHLVEKIEIKKPFRWKNILRR
ncbi:MAG: o-succinylbenzoate synthase [archaeon]